MKPGWQHIRDERARQISELGYSAGNDDQLTARELIDAAHRCLRYGEGYDSPTNRGLSQVRWLVKAGALIAAEIDRLQRIEEKA